MGQFRITVEAVGGHGCQRDKKDGETVFGCGQRSCPDCWARFLVTVLQYSANCQISTATLTHWPETPEQVTDNLLTNVRKGSF